MADDEASTPDGAGSPLVDRRDLLVASAAAGVVVGTPLKAVQADRSSRLNLLTIAFDVNGHCRRLEIDARASLLDALPEHLAQTGAKKADIGVIEVDFVDQPDPLLKASALGVLARRRWSASRRRSPTRYSTPPGDAIAISQYVLRRC